MFRFKCASAVPVYDVPRLVAVWDHVRSRGVDAFRV